VLSATATGSVDADRPGAVLDAASVVGVVAVVVGGAAFFLVVEQLAAATTRTLHRPARITRDAMAGTLGQRPYSARSGVIGSS
jgi:hypothetical protein